MSYEIVKNISVKNKSITSACNNLRPITYRTCKIDAESEEKFIKIVLIEAYLGVFHLQNSKCLLPFRYALFKYEQLDGAEKEDIENKVWNSYDYKTKTSRYTPVERSEALKKLEDILYGFYSNIELTKGKYIISFWNGYGYVSKTRNKGYNINIKKSNAKVYDTFEEATLVNNYLKKLYETDTKVEAL